MKFYMIHEFSGIINRTPQTLRNWEKRGVLIPNHKGPNGYRYYSEEQLSEVLGIRPKQRTVIGYCRVSSSKQNDDLERQIENIRAYLTAQGRPFEMVSDVGSGVDYSKKGLQDMIRRIERNEASKVVVLHKDRLLRFGVELLEYVAKLHGTEIEVIDHTEKTEDEELVEDLIQIVTVFSCRLQGKRANKARKMIKELASDDEDIQSRARTE